jgi:hypothetical protein
VIPTGTFFEAGESKEVASPYPLAEHRVEWQEGVNAEPAWTRVNTEPSQPADGTIHYLLPLENERTAVFRVGVHPECDP